MENALCDLKDNYSLNLVLMTHLEDLQRFLCRPVKFNLITVKFAERDFGSPIDTQRAAADLTVVTSWICGVFFPLLTTTCFIFLTGFSTLALVSSPEHLGVGLLGLLQPGGVEAAAWGEPHAAPPQARRPLPASCQATQGCHGDHRRRQRTHQSRSVGGRQAVDQGAAKCEWTPLKESTDDGAEEASLDIKLCKLSLIWLNFCWSWANLSKPKCATKQRSHKREAAERSKASLHCYPSTSKIIHKSAKKKHLIFNLN